MKFKLRTKDELDRALLWLAGFSLIAIIFNGFHSEFFFVLFVMFWLIRGTNERKRRMIYFSLPILYVFATVFDSLFFGYSIETFAIVNGWVMIGAVIGIILGRDFEVKGNWKYEYKPKRRSA